MERSAGVQNLSRDDDLGEQNTEADAISSHHLGQLEQNIDGAGVVVDVKVLAAIDEIHHRYPNPAG